jgi:hypothetical protein
MKLSKTFSGVVATGTNRLFGKPLWDLGSLGTRGATNLAAYNRDGNEPITLTADTPGSTVLATYVDPANLAEMNMKPDQVDPSTINVPLRDVKVVADLAGRQRVALKGILQVLNAPDPSQAEPSGPITLADWRKAKGKATIKCTDSSSSVLLELSGLIPNRLYTAWGVFSGPMPIPIALGGAPCVFVTNNRGSATFQRVLNFCPLRPTPGQPQFLFIEILYHSDHQVYGLVPALPMAGLHIGAVVHTQLEFPVNVTRAKE